MAGASSSLRYLDSTMTYSLPVLESSEPEQTYSGSPADLTIYAGNIES